MSNRFTQLHCDEDIPITERYGKFNEAVRETAEKVVGKTNPTGLPNWVSPRTIELRERRDIAKQKYTMFKTTALKNSWRALAAEVSKSYEKDHSEILERQLSDLLDTESHGDINTTWKIIHDLSSKNSPQCSKVKLTNGSNPTSEEESVADWTTYFSTLLNNNNSSNASPPDPADRHLPIRTDPPMLDENKTAIRGLKHCKAAALDAGITPEVLKDGVDTMVEFIHSFCQEVYVRRIAPAQWITNLIVPVPKKGDLTLKTNYRGITLMSIAVKVYRKILLNRVRALVDPIL